jgi:hypothetical protein
LFDKVRSPIRWVQFAVFEHTARKAFEGGASYLEVKHSLQRRFGRLLLADERMELRLMLKEVDREQERASRGYVLKELPAVQLKKHAEEADNRLNQLVKSNSMKLMMLQRKLGDVKPDEAAKQMKLKKVTVPFALRAKLSRDSYQAARKELRRSTLPALHERGADDALVESAAPYSP